MARPRRRRCFVGNQVPTKIREHRGVGEHQQGTGKLLWGSMGVRSAWWWLPTAMPSAAGVERERRLRDVGWAFGKCQGI
jgi:hypothetical protein